MGICDDGNHSILCIEPDRKLFIYKIDFSGLYSPWI